MTYSQDTATEPEPSIQMTTIKMDYKSHYVHCMKRRVLEIKVSTLQRIEMENSVPKSFKITISAVGDCILGVDETFTYPGSFTETFNQNDQDYGYFMRNVQDIFSTDDLTLANLEGPLTTATKKAEKQFRFKGDPSYVNILKEGHIEAVNFANNHTYDYFEAGYSDTLKYLKEGEVGVFGDEKSYITLIKDLKIGVLGFNGWNDSLVSREKIETAISSLKGQNCALIIVYFHWGEERMNYPNGTQKNLGRLAIDSGADLVLGCHPHVIQGIENYKDKYIVYSLGNFCFGGNENPSDKDTFIFQQTFYFNGDAENKSPQIKLIPCSISSVTSRNNYQPTPLVGDEADRVIDRINQYSSGLNFSY